MEREEAIQWLKVINTKEFGWDEFALQESQREIRERCEQGVREAIDMAIEALHEADKREQYGQNYEADDFVKLGVTDKNKDKVILYDAFGEKEYYPQTDLVRCKDCRHWDTADGECYGHDHFHCSEANDYCSYGERREP